MVCHLKHKLFLRPACRLTFWSGDAIHGKTRLRMVGVVEVCCMTDIPPSHRHRHFAPQPRYFALQVCNQVTEVVAHPRVAVPGGRLGEIDGSLSVVVVQQDISTKAEQSPHTLRGWAFDCWKRRDVSLQFVSLNTDICKVLNKWVTFVKSTGPLDLGTWVCSVLE